MDARCGRGVTWLRFAEGVGFGKKFWFSGKRGLVSTGFGARGVWMVSHPRKYGVMVLRNENDRGRGLFQSTLCGALHFSLGVEVQVWCGPGVERGKFREK